MRSYILCELILLACLLISVFYIKQISYLYTFIQITYLLSVIFSTVFHVCHTQPQGARQNLNTYIKMAEKRLRNPNFTKDEKVVLLTIITKYKSIVENKKTDHVTWREKDEAWEQISKQFNSASPAGTFRSTETLRKLYDNIKKQTRKSAALEKQSIKKTGGGVDKIKTDEMYDLTLSIINKKSVFGLNSKFDSDGQHADQNNIDDLENTTESLRANWGSWKPSDLQTPTSQSLLGCLSKQKLPPDTNIDKEELVIKNSKYHNPKPSTSYAVNTESEEQGAEEQAPVKNCTESKPSSSISVAATPHCSKSESLLGLGKSTKPWLKRRRPGSETLKKDDLSEIYKEMGEVKLKYYKFQMEDSIKRQEQQREEHDWKKEEYALKKKSLLLDIKLKEEKLKSVFMKDF